MVRHHQQGYVFDERRNAYGTHTNSIGQSLGVVHPQRDEIAPHIHQQDTRRGVHAQRVAEYVHEQPHCHPYHHIRPTRERDRHHQQRQDIDERMAYAAQLQLIYQQHL